MQLELDNDLDLLQSETESMTQAMFTFFCPDTCQAVRILVIQQEDSDQSRLPLSMASMSDVKARVVLQQCLSARLMVQPASDSEEAQYVKVIFL